ncbi:MAG: hypothetical protein ACLQVD_09695 [Capsulimonadaceae bacterium]
MNVITNTATTNYTQSVDVDRVADWIEQTARQLNIDVTVNPNGAILHGNWLTVPVAVNEDGDAFDRATYLQEIEDKWDDLEPFQLYLDLVKRPRAANDTSDIDRLHALLSRQRVLLDGMDLNGIDRDSAERLAAVRQEWENTLLDMERLYPALRDRLA